MLNRIFLFIFGSIGVAMLVAAGFLVYSQVGYLASAHKGIGTVVENRASAVKKGSTYYPVVSFRTETGQTITFEGSVASNPPSFGIGETVPVYYTDDAPQAAKIGTFFQLWFLPMIFGGMGLVFFGIGAGFGISAYLHRKKIAWLQLYGQRIKTQVQGVYQDIGQRSRRSAYRIHSQWHNPFSNQVHVFKSDALWFDPTPYVGAEVDVLIDPQNPRKYWVDTSFLPTLAS